jgi:hypothetical protein
MLMLRKLALSIAQTFRVCCITQSNWQRSCFKKVNEQKRRNKNDREKEIRTENALFGNFG